MRWELCKQHLVRAYDSGKSLQQKANYYSGRITIMNKMSKSIAISSALAAGVLMATSNSALAAKPAMEKCYGIVKAGKNDCAIKSQGTSCAGSAKQDNIHDAWIYLPQGSCEKIAGGNLKPQEKKAEAK